MDDVPSEIADRVRSVLVERLPLRFPGGTVEADKGRILAPTGGGEARVAIDKLIEACAAKPEHSWRAMIDEWLRRIDVGLEPQRRERAALGDVEGELRVRIVGKLSEADHQKLVTVPYLHWLDLLVVLHDPHDPQPFTRERASRLLLTDPARRAIANTLVYELPAFDLCAQPLGRGQSALLIRREGSPYVAASLIRIERYVPRPSPHGALLAIPRQSAVLLYPLPSRAVTPAVLAFGQLARSWYEAADDRCIPQVLWLEGRRVTELDMDAVAGTPRAGRGSTGVASGPAAVLPRPGHVREDRR